ncbi:replication protein [Paenibacillus antarcticus]|uniref:replication protein n=1 Tax=Paenibacillus antarcticus TaxID=253703 RepID=UPI0008385360|nr:replication protein [Paenibacillus antarcticus]
MVSPQKKNGYVGIANEIWDEIIRRDFTKRQKDILMLIIRLSYGCNRKVAFIPKQQDFTLCGLGGKGHVGVELKFLEQCKVITTGQQKGEFKLNKNYDLWAITPVRGWEQERFNELIHLNLIESKKDRKIDSESDESDYEKPQTESYQNGNFLDNEKLPKQELIKKVKVTKTVTMEGEKLLKRELRVTETGTLTPLKPLRGKGYRLAKKGLKKEVIKDSKDMCVFDFETFWSIYPRKLRKKDALGVWEGLLKNKVDPELLIRCTENYAAFCKASAKEDEYILHAATFLNAKKERYMDYEEKRDYSPSNPSSPLNRNLTRSENNKLLLQKRMEAIRNEQGGNTQGTFSDQHSLPNGSTK